MHWLAGIIEIIAKYIVGRKCKWGWIFHIIASILWTIVALQTKVYGLLIVTIPAFFLNFYNFYKWHKK